MIKPVKKVMVFGVFDGLHPGHKAFLRQAKRQGKRLIIVVARDSAVCRLKHRNPRFDEKRRIVAMRRIKDVPLAVLGDKQQGSYGVIKKYKPDIICLGYDQRWLEKDLKMRVRRGLIPKIRLVKLKSYHPRRFKSSKMRDHLFSNS